MEKCMSCQFYDRKSAAGEARSPQWGQCRRTSPMLSPTTTAKSYMIEGVWPTVRDDDWCGEWKVQAVVRRHESLGATHVPKGPAMPTGPRVAPFSAAGAMSAMSGSSARSESLAFASSPSVPVSAGD